ncbi:phosphoribosylglycinamide formyltransferase [Fimicolochytrium jonesii]|uniref:phosphoribosylglycinamide formyltransferase n=1 Tax=Fimicolochytrium jonesii TaxID=1396493 RepID=UPI0022FEE31E|nr:phosphoribosylglycinamide formyltransferase [Fimicolochytrium jonesii]KAI8818191.1 phosphoribosylglycinamide formyltransferase [Fimicolochytrium jonesii]
MGDSTTPLRNLRIVVLISGNGSNLQAIIDATQNGQLNGEVALVISNRKAAFGLSRAEKAGIPTATLSLKKFKDAGKTRVDFDLALAETIKTKLAEGRPTADNEPYLIVLAGFMHILSSDFINQFPPPRHAIINLHPALPGTFDGIDAVERAFHAFQAKSITHTGVMIHKVIPEVDRGDVVLQETVKILDTDTLETLEERIHEVEHRLIVEGARVTLKRLVEGKGL